MNRVKSIAALLAFLSLASAHPVTAAPAEVQVPFDTLPFSVQNALTNYAVGLSDVSRASAWRGTVNGRIVYTGRVTDTDGMMRIIDVDASGRLLQLQQVPRTRSIAPPY
jgi:hypothetical protein